MIVQIYVRDTLDLIIDLCISKKMLGVSARKRELSLLGEHI